MASVAASLELKQGFLPSVRNRHRGGERKPGPVFHTSKIQEDEQNSYEGESGERRQGVGMTAGRPAKVLEACSGGTASIAMRDQRVSVDCVRCLLGCGGPTKQRGKKSLCQVVKKWPQLCGSHVLN